MTDIDLAEVRAAINDAVKAIKDTLGLPAVDRRVDELRAKHPNTNPQLFALMKRAAIAEDRVFELGMDLRHLCNTHPNGVPVDAIRSLLPADTMGGGTDG